MSTIVTPVIRTLSTWECLAILERNHVGRVAYSRDNRVDIEPLHYVYWDGWLYARTSEGAKIRATGYAWWPVAFEVDEVEEVFRWRSVVVHGGFYTIPSRGAAWEVEEWRRGVELLREVIPETFTVADPVPFRDILVRISVLEVSGREASPDGSAGA